MDWDDMEREAAADDRKKKREGEDEQDARPRGNHVVNLKVIIKSRPL